MNSISPDGGPAPPSAHGASPTFDQGSGHLSSGSSPSHRTLFNSLGSGASPATGPAPDAASTTSSVASSTAAPTVPAACLACRSKHLKCDGQTPCSRCISGGFECIYVASRRGYKGPRRGTAANPNKRHASSPPPSVSSSSGDSCPIVMGYTGSGVAMPSSGFNPATMVMPGTPASSVFTATPSATHMQLYRNPFTSPNGLDAGTVGFLSSGMAVPYQQQQQQQQQQLVLSPAERAFESYYEHFWGAHPCVPPKQHFLQLLKQGNNKLDALIAAMRWIGTLFYDAGPTRAMFLDEAMRLVYAPTTPKDGFLVQTMLLLVVGLDGQTQRDKARQLLLDVEKIALDIGIYQRSFAVANGQGSPVLEESWRRTWWDLFIVDGMVAGVHRETNFHLYDAVVADVALPCEEHEYVSGHIPPPMTLEDFDDQMFSGEERPFSSFAYRIEMGRILGRFMRCPPMLFPQDENIEKIQALLTNWKIHLPANKRDALTRNCTLDEMMFQAHFMNHTCTIMLHQPHSQLDSSPARAVTSCSPHSIVPHGDSFNFHTKHTITAACEISKMITHAVPLFSHTHFFTCVITHSSIVHLSKWALYILENEEDLRQLIRLNVGALGKLSTVWRAAGIAAGQVKGVAQEIYRAKKAQQINPAFWVGFTQEEMMSSLNTDDGIMSDMGGFGAMTHA